MALNPDFIGRSYPPSPPYAVGREKIREFAMAVGDHNPAYHDVDAARALGYRDVIAPPTFPVVLALKAMAAASFEKLSRVTFRAAFVGRMPAMKSDSHA